MAEQAKKTTKKRQLKKTETVRERAGRSDVVAKKQSPIRKVLRALTWPLRKIWVVLSVVLRPFSFLLMPFKTRPARAIGRVLASVLLFRFFRDAWKEIRQVQWPTAKETARLTMAVFVFSLVFGAIVAITDYGLEIVFKKVFID